MSEGVVEVNILQDALGHQSDACGRNGHSPFKPVIGERYGDAHILGILAVDMDTHFELVIGGGYRDAHILGILAAPSVVRQSGHFG